MVTMLDYKANYMPKEKISEFECKILILKKLSTRGELLKLSLGGTIREISQLKI